MLLLLALYDCAAHGHSHAVGTPLHHRAPAARWHPNSQQARAPKHTSSTGSTGAPGAKAARTIAAL
eukprot:6994964-Prymnesium_polylepis.4